MVGKQGRESIDEILEKLKNEDPRFMEPGVLGEVNFDNYSRRSVRRLGRLLPRARGVRKCRCEILLVTSYMPVYSMIDVFQE